MERDEHEVVRDTIAAIATPAGRGGIGIVRLSGARVPAIAHRVLGVLPAPRYATLRAFRDASGAVIDEGIALFFPAPASYTGEAMLELQGHGGPVVMRALLAACIDAGARAAEPGEFTQRAFLGGKLDLAQAEGVADLIDAASREAARSALRSLQGEFSAAISGLRDQLIAVRMFTEATLDFPEEQLDSMERQEATRRLAAVRDALQAVREQSRRGSVLREGLHVVLAGRPNVGKSSLLNRLVGAERAIVTPVPGTTRDTLHEAINIDGVPLVVVDTAGLRQAQDLVERLGVERSRREIETADLVIAVNDASTGETAPETPQPRLEVYNKIDLAPAFVPPPGALAVSAKTGQGLDLLRAALLRAAGWSATGETPFLARERHLRALEEAAGHLDNAAALTDRQELFAEELRLAHVALGRITGQYTADDLLGEIFTRFCIGK